MIGVDGGLPWRLATDLRRFRELTTGHVVIMGRRTWDSIGRPLPDRRSIVVTRNPVLTLDGATVVRSFAAALDTAATLDRPVDVIGGAAIYRDALPHAGVLALTRVHARPDGDTWFPAIDQGWERVWSERHTAGADDDHDFTFERWERR